MIMFFYISPLYHKFLEIRVSLMFSAVGSFWVGSFGTLALWQFGPGNGKPLVTRYLLVWHIFVQFFGTFGVDVILCLDMPHCGGEVQLVSSLDNSRNFAQI